MDRYKKIIYVMVFAAFLKERGLTTQSPDIGVVDVISNVAKNPTAVPSRMTRECLEMLGLPRSS